jgi:hypothetical protein
MVKQLPKTPSAAASKLATVQEHVVSLDENLMVTLATIIGIPGSSRKTAIDQKVSTSTGSPQTPSVSMLLTIASPWPEQEWLFFCEGSAKHCCHATLKLGEQGCLTLLARLQGIIGIFIELLILGYVMICQVKTK